MKVEVKTATQDERNVFLQGDEGATVYENDMPVAFVAYNTRQGVFYAHSLYSQGSPQCVAMLVQWVRNKAKEAGYGSIHFHIQKEFPSLVKWLKDETATIVEAICELKT